MPEHPHPLSHRFQLTIKSFFFRLAKILLGLFAITLGSLLIVLPTWYAANFYPQTYSISVIIILSVTILTFLIDNFLKALKRWGWNYLMIQIILPKLKQLVPGLFLTLLGLSALFFLLTEKFAPASLLGLLFFLGVGLRIL